MNILFSVLIEKSSQVGSLMVLGKLQTFIHDSVVVLCGGSCGVGVEDGLTSKWHIWNGVVQPRAQATLESSIRVSHP